MGKEYEIGTKIFTRLSIESFRIEVWNKAYITLSLRKFFEEIKRIIESGVKK